MTFVIKGHPEVELAAVLVDSASIKVKDLWRLSSAKFHATDTDRPINKYYAGV